MVAGAAGGLREARELKLAGQRREARRVELDERFGGAQQPARRQPRELRRAREDRPAATRVGRHRAALVGPAGTRGDDPVDPLGAGRRHDERAEHLRRDGIRARRDTAGLGRRGAALRRQGIGGGERDRDVVGMRVERKRQDHIGRLVVVQRRRHEVCDTRAHGGESAVGQSPEDDIVDAERGGGAAQLAAPRLRHVAGLAADPRLIA